MVLKPGVEFVGVQGACVLGILLVDKLFEELGYTLTVTSITDYTPGRTMNSLHPKGLAFDIRRWDFDDSEVEVIAEHIRNRLGEEWDVVVKSDHIHCECDA